MPHLETVMEVKITIASTCQVVTEALFVVEKEKVESGVENSLDYIVASKPAWATGDLVSKGRN